MRILINIIVLVKDKSNTKDGKDSASNSNAIEAMVVNKETISMDKSLVVEICNTTKNKKVSAQRKEVTLKEMNPLYFKLMENPLVFDNASSSDKHSNNKDKKEIEKAQITQDKRHKIYFDFISHFITFYHQKT